MRVACWNIRFDSKPDDITVAETLASLPSPLDQPPFLKSTREQPWSTRRIKVARQLLSQGVILAGFQEALVRQVNDLQELFGAEDFDFVGVGRNDGVTAGEFCPIFYKTSDLTLLSHDTFWLSDTPFKPSKFPGAGSFRICTAARFELKSGNGAAYFTHLNTHLDDRSDAQRRLGASLILHRARFEAVNNNSPVIITGDFNSASTGADSGAYKIITGAIPAVAIDSAFATKFAVPDIEQPNFTAIDLLGVTQPLDISGNFATFTGFTAPTNTSSWTRIDFLFGGSNRLWSSEQFEVGNSLTDDGVLASDHRPVFATVAI